MPEFASQYDRSDENLYTLPDHDPLAVLTTTRAVLEQAEYVWINPEQVELLSERWIQHDQDHPVSTPLWDTRYHFYDGTERSVNWLLLLDALNFCFWSQKGQVRWTITYQGETLNGYWAEAVALKRAVEEGIPLWDAQYLSTIPPEMVAHIFRGEQTIPLLEQRVENAREVGRVLLERYDGQFARAIEQAQGSAIKLVSLLVHDFPSFYDVARYRHQPVRFFKRAQICVADLHNAFAGQQWGAFTDMHLLTAFADYKLPQVLRHYNVLEYHARLAQLVDNQELLEASSEQELEIRAATIWACELLQRAMQRRGRLMTASEIDYRLWLAGQNAGEMQPYHRTRTQYY